MKNMHHGRVAKVCNAALAAALLAALMLSPDPGQMLSKRGIFMTEAADAAETHNTGPDRTTPPARDPAIAVEEEYRLALQKGTVQALELFIARHPDDPRAEKARADLRRLSR